MPASSDDYEMSLDGITLLPEWSEEYDVDPIEIRDTKKRRHDEPRSVEEYAAVRM